MLSSIATSEARSEIAKYCEYATSPIVLLFLLPVSSGPSTLPVPEPLILRVWEAVNTERSLQRVLEAAADELLAVVPFAAVSLISLGHPERPDQLLAAHVVGRKQRENESLSDYLDRPEFANRVAVVPKPLVPYEPTVAERARSGEPYSCADILAKDGWYEHEFLMAASGIRAYVTIPLLVRGALIGGAAFTRLEPLAFSPEEIAVLRAAGRALAVAVSNALANEEITRLRRQVEAENIELKARLGQAPWFDEIAGESAAIRAVLERVDQVATTDATVLITGDTGTGKELIARALHRRSPRAGGPLVKVHCAAIPETLLASELFGHERGAFTGASERRRGRFEEADGGTIFLDEVGELSLSMQVMLLRVLQEREIQRLGSGRTLKVDVRVVAATNRDLVAAVAESRFRRDLYYRLNVFPVHVPPLRERLEDIPVLVAHFASRYGERFGREVTRLERGALRRLVAYHWPGNVRELENVIERAVILSRGGTLRLDQEVLPNIAPSGPSLAGQVEAHEREAIESALAATRGRVAGSNGAAARLAIPPSTLEFRIRRLNIDKHRFKRT
jgi:formate hydrogenlyase transcriptional activator